VLYGDLLFRDYILSDLLDAQGELVVVVDSAPLPGSERNLTDLAFCSASDNRELYGQDVELQWVTKDRRWQEREPGGRWIGMLRIRGDGQKWVLDALEQLRSRNNFAALGLPDLLNYLVECGRSVKVLYIHGHWLDVNNLKDLQRANDFAQYQVS